MMSAIWTYFKELLGLEEKKEPKTETPHNCGTISIDPWEWKLAQTEDRIINRIDELEKKIGAEKT